MINFDRDLFYGHYSIVYSPDDGGWYAELWWKEQDNEVCMSPIFSSKAKAKAWAIEQGGTIEH